MVEDWAFGSRFGVVLSGGTIVVLGTFVAGLVFLTRNRNLLEAILIKRLQVNVIEWLERVGFPWELVASLSTLKQ